MGVGPGVLLLIVVAVIAAVTAILLYGVRVKMWFRETDPDAPADDGPPPEHVAVEDDSPVRLTMPRQ